MKHIHFKKEINAYFSVQSLGIYQQDISLTEMHKWFSVFIINELAGTIRIDNEDFSCDSPTVLFITPGQIVSLAKVIDWKGFVVSFNSEFYCIEYHDSEISCKGLLFVNNFRIVSIKLNEQQSVIFNNTVLEIAREFETGEDLLDEMLKNLLKNLLIRSNRLFKQQCTGESDDINFEMIRKLSSLIEMNFRTHKQVEYYAELMGFSSSSLTKKLQKAGIDSPSIIIRERIITEAKRMLIYSDKSIKEIAAFLGYDDQYYFSRLFSNSTGNSPSKYRVNYQIN
jgi:AraC-like DNA-binding protein